MPKQNIEWKIEMIDDDHSRVKTFGGWLLTRFDRTGDGSCRTAMVFIADPAHEWEIGNEEITLCAEPECI